MATPAPIVTLVSALLGGGTAKLAYDVWKEWRHGSPKQLSVASVSIGVVSKARDELVEDNNRLREELREKDVRHATERQQWLEDRVRLRADIERLETELRLERAASVQREQEAQRRYDSLLEQVRGLGARTEKTMEEPNG